MEKPSTAEAARIAADQAAILAQQAREAEQNALLDGIEKLKDFDRVTKNRFASTKLKSAFVARFGLPRFEALCGESR
jgi:hypothetical protein